MIHLSQPGETLFPCSPMQAPLILSFLLPNAPGRFILLQNSFLELDFVFLFSATFSAGFSSCIIVFRSWESTNLSLYIARSTSPVPFALLPLGDCIGTALELSSVRCSHGSSLGVSVLHRGETGHASWRSVDEPYSCDPCRDWPT